MSAPLTFNAKVKVQKMKSKTVKIGRNASTGRFTPVKVATQHKSTHVVETIRKK